MSRLDFMWKRRALAAILDASLRIRLAKHFLLLVRVLSFGLVHLQHVHVVWLSRTQLGVRVLRRNHDGEIYPPRGIGDSPQRQFVRIPDIKVFEFSDAMISALSSSVLLTKENLLMLDGVPDSDPPRFDYSLGHLRRHTSTKAITRIKDHARIERGIHLTGNGACNYYHWLMEILPKLEFLADLPEPHADSPLLVSEPVLRVPQLREALDLFSNGRTVISLDPDSAYVVSQLIYINSPNALPFNLVGRQRFQASDHCIDKRAIDFVRGRVWEALRGSGARKSFPSRVFLSRLETRRSYNQREVEEMLERFGFETVYPETLSLLEQATMIQQADAIVGPTGAAWTNLAFVQRNTRCLCWMAEEIGDFSAFSTIAQLYDADLRYLRYKSDTRTTADLYSMDYILDTRELSSALVALGL